MALIESGQIELIDLTDGRAANFSLTASLSKVQTEDNGNYSPDYSQSSQVITPSLYLGQDKVESGSYDVVYTIDGVDYAGGNEGEPIYVDSSHRLIISKNLKQNTMLITATTVSTDIRYQGLIAQIELTKLSSASNTYFAFLTPSRSVFTAEDRSDITITANLYNGDDKMIADKYAWYKNGQEINGQTSKTIEISVNDIATMSTYSCKISLNSNVYCAETTIMDYSDPYSSQIISSAGLIFTNQTTETTLTCSVFKGSKDISEDTNNNLTYSWRNSINSITNTGRIVKFSITDFSIESVTYYCDVSINGEIVTTSQITLLVTNNFNINLAPKQIFLPFGADGTYKGGDEYTLNFSLTSSSGVVLEKDNDDKIKEVTWNFNTKFFLGYPVKDIDSNSNEWEYTIHLLKNKGSETESPPDFTEFPDSVMGTISFTYKNVPFTEEFYLVKSIQGSSADATEIVGIKIEYRYSNNGLTNPDETAGENQLEWYENIITAEGQAKEEKQNPVFLWTKTTYTYSDNTKQITYSVSMNSSEIEKMSERYALGTRRTDTGIIVQSVIYASNDSTLPIAVTFPNDGNDYFIFDSDGNVMYENGHIYHWENNVKTPLPDNKPIITQEYVVLFSPNAVEWEFSVPVSESESIGKQPSESNPNDFIEVLISDPIDNGKFVKAGSSLFSESLWVKYFFIYKNGSTGTTDPIPLEEINNLRLSGARAETIYNNDSIISIVNTTDWGTDGTTGEPYNLVSYIRQLADSIELKVSEQDFNTYFRLDISGVTIGKSTSKYTAFIDDNGFDIRYFPNGWTPTDSPKADPMPPESYKTIGTFDSVGLNVPQITLRNDYYEKNTSLQTLIVLQGTSTGGWAWFKGTNRATVEVPTGGGN